MKGIVVGGVNINNLRYADNTVLIADSAAQLQELINAVNESGKPYGMTMNVEKTNLEHIFAKRIADWTCCRYTVPEDQEKAPLIIGTTSPEVKSRADTRDSSQSFSQSLLESAIIHERVIERENEANKENADGHAVWSMPHHDIVKQITWLLVWPISLFFYLTIPDCRVKFWEKFYALTFLMSIVWLGILSYFTVWMVTIIGFTLGIPDTIMGLTLLAIGTSLPEIVASVIVTREGLGNMAIGNNIGSNVFDILFCLGLPWCLKALISSENIVIQSGGLLYSSIMLLATVVLFITALWMTRWKLNKALGSIAAVLYVIFLTFAILYELNIFGVVNKPSCLQ
ncbi:Sodium/potassium/calcium exchanger 5 [Nymphon striatum]|nr:Sodium/potassium/calcium exchanger 5 [Nymphon striatum]KAG1671229.1 Sodium/potassium/calcium exchanger 5 [Nymphon striatum]KAG1671230.1 Sodium/potassium/calcium exchanger 5 [Nymphon striatum]KAG1671232.1 Sodium/potassium/calcium exchanger 5 [Nymphon striatum]